MQKSYYLKQPTLSEKSLAQLKGRDESKVSEAQKWFNNRFPQTRAGNSEWQLIWNYAFTDSLAKSQTVEIPIAFMKQKKLILPECMQMYEQTNDERYLQNIVRFIIEKNNLSNETRSYFMIIMPSIRYLEKKNFIFNQNSYARKDSDFDGYIMFCNNQGYFTNGWKYENGKATATMSYAQDDITTRAAQKICMYETTTYYVDWYVNGVFDHSQKIREEKVELDCWIEGGYTPPGGGNGGGGSGGNSGNSGGEYDDSGTPGVQYGKHGKIGPCTDCYEEIPEDDKIPCKGNPVPSPEICPQRNSGIRGGMWGWTRSGGKQRHNGVDIKTNFGDPIYSMYDGTATLREQIDKKTGKVIKAGYYVEVSSVINGKTVQIRYFHMQKDERVSGKIKAGDIIGYQGDSGSLKEAIKQGLCGYHVHVTIIEDGEEVNPLSYFTTTIDTKTGKVINPCDE